MKIKKNGIFPPKDKIDPRVEIEGPKPTYEEYIRDEKAIDTREIILHSHKNLHLEQ